MIAATRILSTLVLSLSFAAPAFARSDEDVFNTLVGRVAPNGDVSPGGKFKPKLACVCLSDNSPGVLVSVGSPGFATPVRCLLPTFSDGVYMGGLYCDGDFVSLGR